MTDISIGSIVFSVVEINGDTLVLFKPSRKEFTYKIILNNYNICVKFKVFMYDDLDINTRLNYKFRYHLYGKGEERWKLKV